MKSKVLRFITAGSVDDGKSTLIGRLLFDSKGIFPDQLEDLSRSKYKRTVGSAIDLSLLTDGLVAEREQGITIDVAYRYFSTPRRKFIIADCPGHEQYTRNMVTGASTADAMVILIDAAKMQKAFTCGEGLLIQTKRHSSIAQLLQIKHIIVAINKMDLVSFSENTFGEIVSTYKELAAQLDLKGVSYIPMSALSGENLAKAGENMPWYHGPTLLEALESLPEESQSQAFSFRFPVQWVARHSGFGSGAGSGGNSFRGYMGRVEAGQVCKGDVILIQPSGQKATVKEILLYDVSLDIAQAGQSVTLLFEEQVDVSRGDLLASVEVPANVVKEFEADLCWLSEAPLDLKHRYWLKHTTKQTMARVTGIQSLLEMSSQKRGSAENLKLNDIARVSLSVQEPLVVDAYESLRATGSFILIDEITHQTAAAGMIRFDV